MCSKLRLLILPLLIVVALSGCSLLWPSATIPPLELTDGPAALPGSFVPLVMPTMGDGVRLQAAYLLDHAQRYLVPYVLTIDKTEGIARDVLTRLIDNDANQASLRGTEFVPPFPTATTILGMTIRDGLAIVDLSQQFLDFRDVTHERLAIDALVYTLTEFDNVNRVELRVDGHKVTNLPSGLELTNPCARSDRPLNLEVSPAVANLEHSTQVKLYFSAVGPAGGLIYFVPVTRHIMPQNDPLAAVVLELIAGPLADSGLHADISLTTEMRAIKVVDGVVHIDFSTGLIDYGGGTAAENAMLGALVLSLTDIPGVNGVKITINGQTPMLPEGTDVSQPVSRPLFVNPFVL